LPCRHTFCLRPCLLSHARAMTARCIHCHVEFDAATLRPNYAIGARLCLLALQREQEQEQVVRDGGAGEEATVNDEKRTGGTPPTFAFCSTCRKQTQLEQLAFCQHCYRQICVQCREKHRDSYSLGLRVKLNALTRYKANLKSQLLELEKLKASVLGMEEKAKEQIAGAVENAVTELRAAASKALEAATAKVEVADVADFEILDGLVHRITSLSTEAGKARDVHTSIEGIKKSLERLLADAEPLEKMVDELPPLPLMQLQLSDRLKMVELHLSDFSLVVCDGVVSLPQLPRISSPCDIGDQRNTTSCIAAVTRSQTKLYVCGLRPNHTEDQLLQHFTQYGTVIECCIARSYNTKKSRGFGFVSFEEEAEAMRALTDCQHLIEGGPVQVKPYKLKTKESLVVSSSAKDGDDENVRHNDEGGGCGGRKEVDELSLFVCNLRPSTTQQALREYFSRYGNVTGVNVILDRGSGKPRGIAFVKMTTPREVEAVLEARPHILSGECIVVRPAYTRASKEAAAFNGDASSHLLVVHNVWSSWREERIWKLFSRFGTIVNVRLDGSARKAYVTFSTAEALSCFRKQKYLNIDDVRFLTSPGNNGTCSLAVVNS
uniref:RRM domain-containing protein n=1 Tax=Taenia asiatica TaxID=60517 RepID=A0A0R3WAZ3_TAEAS